MSSRAAPWAFAALLFAARAGANPMRSVAPVTVPLESGGAQAGAGIAGAAPSLAVTLSPVLPTAASPLVLPSAAVSPTLSVPAARPAAAAAAAASPALAQPAAAASAVVLPNAEGDIRPQAASIILPGQEGGPSVISQAGRARKDAAWAALFDGGLRAAPPLDLSLDGTAPPLAPKLLLSEPAPRAGPARARIAQVAQAAQPILAEAVSARKFMGRSMSLDDPCCGVAAPILGVLLRRAGVSVDGVQAEFHTYLIHRDGERTLVVDPAIRQFFGGAKAPADIPRVFIGTLGELEQFFATHQAAKSTKYDVRRIYLSEASIANAVVKEAEDAAEKAAQPARVGMSQADVVEGDTYRPLARALALSRPRPAEVKGRSLFESAPAPANAAASESRGFLRSLKELFFPPLVPDASWEAVKAALPNELERFRALPKAAQEAYLRRVGDEVVSALKATYGTSDIGFHYNLHGGRPEQYLVGGGIKATMGDIALQYDMHADRAYKVYLFRSSKINLYDVLNERHPSLFLSRMGDVLMLFRLDSAFLKQAFEMGLARKPTDISIDFDEGRLPGMVGIPKDTFLGEPMAVFGGAAKRYGLGRLSRDEETLAVMRYIAQRLDAPPPA